MRYTHVLNYVASTIWAILPAKLSEIFAVLATRAAGHEFTDSEIRARLGDDRSIGRTSESPSRRLAVLPIHGTIAHRIGSMADSSGGISCERIARYFRQAVADDTIDTVLLDIDSPGGTVPGVSELAAEIYAARPRVRIVAAVNDHCCSAAYWLAAQAHEIVSIPSGTAGSIGVFAAHTNLQKALEKEGVEITLLQYGTRKTEGNPFQPLSDETRAHLQRQIDQAGTQFVADVARGRGLSPAQVRERYGDGRCFIGDDAVRAGLVDRIELPDQTVARLVAAPELQATLQAKRVELARAMLAPQYAAQRRALAAALAGGHSRPRDL